jgi:hypothetical protein
MSVAVRRKGRGLSAEDLARLTAERAVARAEARAHEDRIAQTAALARQRGETVEQAQGRLRITSRDGPQSLYEHGGLERPEYDAGMMYRRCYETLHAGPRSNLARDFSAGVRGVAEAPADGFAELRAFRAEKLRQWEGLAKTGRQVWILRLVAGQGRSINSIAPGGSARAANTKALIGVLGEIAKARGLRR